MKTLTKLIIIGIVVIGMGACSEEDAPLPGSDLNTSTLYHEDGRSSQPQHRDGQTGDDDGGSGGEAQGNRGPIYE